MIGSEAKIILEKDIGLSLSQVCDLSVYDEINLVKAKTGKDLIFSRKRDSRKIGRGNPLLARKRITTIEEVNAKIDALQKWCFILPTFEERVKDIYKNYIEVICPYIIQYELLDNSFPIEIINEIRAVFTHLSKYYLSDDVLTKEKNVTKAESHIKRTILDCYKYICTAYEDKYKAFEEKYKHVDLSNPIKN